MPQDRPEIAGAAERREKAFELRIRGKSYRKIAKEVGVSHVQVSRYIHEALEESAQRVALKADQLREIEVARVDAQMDALWDKRSEPQCASVLIRIAERRSKLLGLDAPTKLEHMLEPGQVQTLLGFALGGALQGFSEIRDAVVSLGKVGEVVLELIDQVQGSFVQEFEQRSRSELQPGSEAG